MMKMVNGEWSKCEWFDDDSRWWWCDDDQDGDVIGNKNG